MKFYFILMANLLQRLLYRNFRPLLELLEVLSNEFQAAPLSILLRQLNKGSKLVPTPQRDLSQSEREFEVSIRKPA